MALKDIIGQERALAILQGCIEKDRVPHALLFAGDDGIGKKLAAINYAKTLNCRKEVMKADSDEGMGSLFLTPSLPASITSPDSLTASDACDKCPSCLKIHKLFDPESLITPEENEEDLKGKIYISHPDVALIIPYKEEIRIRVIRKLEEALSYKPYEGSFKIAIIDNAETMNEKTANALLATLEAPPGQSILILITSRPDMLLPTIRSRCQRVNFNPLPLEVMSGLLLQKSKKMDRQQVLLLSMLSGGRLGHALDEDLIKRRNKAFSILKQMLLSPGDDIKGEADSLEELFDWAQAWLRDIAVFRATGCEEYLINTDLINDIRTAAAGAELKDILKLAQELYNIRQNLKFNLNEKLTKNYTSLIIRKRLGRIDAGK